MQKIRSKLGLNLDHSETWKLNIDSSSFLPRIVGTDINSKENPDLNLIHLSKLGYRRFLPNATFGP